MNTVLIFSHPGIGSALRTAAQSALTVLPCEVITIDCPQDAEPQARVADALSRIKAIDENIIIFTDIFGATPHNIATLFAEQSHRRTLIISGVNLPMLMRTLNYITLPLETLCEKAIEGGLTGICDVGDANIQEH